jgi:hypothetical protein
MIQGFPEDLPAAIWLGLDGLETVGRVLSDTISIEGFEKRFYR